MFISSVQIVIKFVLLFTLKNYIINIQICFRYLKQVASCMQFALDGCLLSCKGWHCGSFLIEVYLQRKLQRSESLSEDHHSSASLVPVYIGYIIQKLFFLYPFIGRAKTPFIGYEPLSLEVKWPRMPHRH